MNVAHSHWRDCQQWDAIGLRLSTTSNEACKLYDAALTQFTGYYEDPSVGGLIKCVQNMIQADPDFVMGHAFAISCDLLNVGHSARIDPEFRANIDNMVALSERFPLTWREKRHVDAVKAHADGHVDESGLILEDILLDHPTDMMAIKSAHLAHFYEGDPRQIRDCIARVLPHWTPQMPLYGYLKGIHAFGLLETNMFTEAEKVAREGLELNRSDTWSTHALAHVMEMQGRYNEGISLLSTTVQDWEPCGLVSSHNFWHWAVFHIEKGEHERALEIFDAEVLPRVSTANTLSLADGCSLLKRLELEGLSVGDRWQEVFERCRPHLEDHLCCFNDLHYLMASLGAGEKDATQEFIQSIKQFIREGDGLNRDVTDSVGLSMCEALVAYENGDYDKAVDSVYPLRYQLDKISGSGAQRDVFSLFLISAALKSTNKRHHKLARHLLSERRALKDDSPMTDRLLAKALALV